MSTPNGQYGWEGFFDGTGAGELQVLLVSFYADVLTPCPCPPRFQADAAAAGVVGRGRAVRQGTAAAAGRGRYLSSLLLLCYFVTMPRSRPVHVLLFPLPPVFLLVFPLAFSHVQNSKIIRISLKNHKHHEITVAHHDEPGGTLLTFFRPILSKLNYSARSGGPQSFSSPPF